MTTSSAANVESFIKMTTFLFQWTWCCCVLISLVYASENIGQMISEFLCFVSFSFSLCWVDVLIYKVFMCVIRAGLSRARLARGSNCMESWHKADIFVKNNNITTILDLMISRQTLKHTEWYILINCSKKSIGLCKKDITPVLMHWSYVFLPLTHW